MGSSKNPTDEELDSLVKKYKSQVILPDRKPRQQFILCPVGLVGSGKTTVLKPLSQRLNLARVSSDEIRFLLKEKDFGWDFAGEIGIRVAKELATEGYSIAADADCGNPRAKNELEEFAKKEGIILVWIHINTPETQILKRLKKTEKLWLFGDGEGAISNYFSQKKLREKQHRGVSFPFVYTFDTSKEKLGEQLKEAIECIEDKISSNRNEN